MSRCLRLPAFRRLLAAYVLNEFAWSIGTLALSLLVYRETRSALGSAAFFICSQFLPAVLSPALVTRLDVHAMRRVLPVLYAVEALLFGILVWFTHHFALVPVLVLALMDGAIAAAARSLAAAARTQILKPLDLLHEGNALSNFGFSGALMAGPVLGGLVVAAGGTVAALLVNCGLFAGIALVLSVTVLPDARPPAGSGLSRLFEGVAQVRRDRLLSRLLAVQAVGLVFFTISIPVEVVYAQHTLRAGPKGYGVLLGAWGLGAVVGSAAFARWRRRSTVSLIVASGLSVAAGFGIMAVAPTLVVAVVGAALVGLANGVESIAARTAVQQQASDQWMALVMSLNDSISQLAPGLGILLGGVIAAAASSRIAFGVAAAGALGFALAVPVVLRGTVAAHDNRPPPPGPAPAASEEAGVSERQSLV